MKDYHFASLCCAGRTNVAGAGASRKQTMRRGRIVPASGHATDGVPRAFERSRKAKRRKRRSDRLCGRNFPQAHPVIATVLVGIVLLLGTPAAQALKSDAQQPINIRARSVEASEKTGISVYRGDVVMSQGSLRLEADRVEVRLRNGQTELIRAWGKPVRLRSRTDDGEDIRARAARAEYRAPGRRIDLYGDVELKRGVDVFTGAVVHYALDAQSFTAEGGDGGQVTAVIQPAKQETAP